MRFNPHKSKKRTLPTAPLRGASFASVLLEPEVRWATLEHLDEALAGTEMGPLPEDALAKLNRVYESGFAT